MNSRQIGGEINSSGLEIEVEGDPSARGLGYVDISYVSYRGYPEMELMSA